MIGGFLSRPADLLPQVFSPTGFFGKYPYFLPCLMSALVSLVGLLIGFFYLKETLKGKSIETVEEYDHVEVRKFLNRRSTNLLIFQMKDILAEEGTMESSENGYENGDMKDHSESIPKEEKGIVISTILSFFTFGMTNTLYVF